VGSFHTSHARMRLIGGECAPRCLSQKTRKRRIPRDLEALADGLCTQPECERRDEGAGCGPQVGCGFQQESKQPSMGLMSCRAAICRKRSTRCRILAILLQSKSRSCRNTRIVFMPSACAQSSSRSILFGSNVSAATFKLIDGARRQVVSSDEPRLPGRTKRQPVACDHRCPVATSEHYICRSGLLPPYPQQKSPTTRPACHRSVAARPLATALPDALPVVCFCANKTSGWP